MEKDDPAVKIHMSGYLIGTFNGSNGKNFRNSRVRIPGRQVKIQHKKHKECQKKGNGNHKNNAEGMGDGIFVSAGYVQDSPPFTQYKPGIPESGLFWLSHYFFQQVRGGLVFGENSLDYISYNP
jgi:hypothetical protein